jgi:hypothetical protein
MFFNCLLTKFIMTSSNFSCVVKKEENVSTATLQSYILHVEVHSHCESFKIPYHVWFEKPKLNGGCVTLKSEVRMPYMLLLTVKCITLFG